MKRKHRSGDVNYAEPVTILGFCLSPVTGGLVYTIDTEARGNLDPAKGPWGVELEIST